VLRSCCKYLDLDSNQDLDLRRVRMRSVTPSRQISQHEREESNPREAVLEAAGSPGSTLV
jgi:hypothetical protein